MEIGAIKLPQFQMVKVYIVLLKRHSVLLWLPSGVRGGQCVGRDWREEGDEGVISRPPMALLGI